MLEGKVAYDSKDMFNWAFIFFSYYSTVVVQENNIDKYKILLEVHKRVYKNTQTVKVLHYKEFGISYLEFKAREFKTEKEKLGLKKNVPLKISRAPTDIITTSHIQAKLFENILSDVKYRGLPPELYGEVKNSLQLIPNVYDLGDTHDIQDADVLEDKLLKLYNSKFYIGAACGWSRWGMVVGTPTIITLYGNRLNKLKFLDPTTIKNLFRHIF